MSNLKISGAGPSLKEQVYYQMLESLMKGEIPPEEIINEKALVEHFGISKSPVREALIELCNEGVLRSIPRCGYQVMRLTDFDVANIRDWRLILECGYLKERWHMITPEAVTQLEERWAKEMNDGDVQNVFVHWQRNNRFHLEMFSFYKNPYASEQLEKALRTLTRAYAQFYWDKWQHTIFKVTSDYHCKLLDALRRGERDESVKLLAKDISHFHTHDTSAFNENMF